MTYKVFAIFCVFVMGSHLWMVSVLGEANIITRAEWNAKEPANALTPLELPVGRVIIAHTAGNDCKTKVS